MRRWFDEMVIIEENEATSLNSGTLNDPDSSDDKITQLSRLTLDSRVWKEAHWFTRVLRHNWVAFKNLDKTLGLRSS